MNLRKLAQNIFSQWVMLGTQLIISVVMTPFLVRRLGDEGYGIIALISGLVGYHGILYFGLGAAVVKFVAEHHAKEDREALDETVSTIFTIYLAIGVLWLILSLLLAPVLPGLFHLPAAKALDAQLMLLMMGVALFIHFPGSVYGGVVMGLERFDVLNRYNFVLLLLRTSLTVAAVSWRPSVLLVGAINMVTLLAEPVVAWVFARRLVPWLTVSVKSFSRARMRELFTFSTQSFLFTLSEKLINYTDEFVISQARGPGAVTNYVIPLRLVDYARDALDKATLVLMPGVSAAAARGEITTLQTLWRFGNKAVMCLVAPVSLVFVCWGHHVLSLWLDAEHADKGYPPLVWLAFAFIVQVAGRGLARPIFEGLGWLSIPARITVIEGVLNLAMSVVLVRTWGIAGVGFATFVPAAISGVLVMPWYVCQRLGVSFVEHLGRTFVRTLPPLVPAYGVLWAAERWGLHRHLVTTALVCLAVLIVYVVFAWGLTFSREERGIIRARVGRA
ncbi:MAG: oligosaccharide flippase family protein [Myxococcales bacterium]|nr:oligosaccharide flippase family protein [Myxococcales bacterium]